jgi:pimeloyl-ACP methyl ester carboxylesterase
VHVKLAVHVGHSTGGEVVHYLARHGESRVAKAVIISAVPPLMVKTAANPGGLPKEVFDDLPVIHCNTTGICPISSCCVSRHGNLRFTRLGSEPISSG